MSIPENFEHTLAFVCDPRGDVIEVLSDPKHILRVEETPAPLNQAMSSTARKRFLRFLGLVVEDGSSLLRDLPLAVQGEKHVPFAFFGVLREGLVFVLALESPQQLFTMYEEFMSIINEQARLLRDAQKQTILAQRSQPDDVEKLEDYMRLNNELVNMQREHARKNRLLEQQERRFKQLINFNPDALIVVDEDSRILFSNPAAQKIFTSSAFSPVGDKFPLDIKRPGEFCATKNGVTICVELRTTGITWEDSPALLVSLLDITERKQLEQLKEDIDRIMRHDLKTPLNPIISFTSILMEDDTLSKEQSEIVQLIYQSGNRMLDLINLSLDMHKMEQGTYQLAPHPVDVYDIMLGIMEEYEHFSDSKNLTLRMNSENLASVGEKDMLIHGDGTLCYSMFANLVLNAIEAAPENSCVSITLEKRSELRVSIHNLGAAPPDIRDTFFEKYATSGKANGTGLGAYSARLIARAHSGDITMQTSDEEGTTVTVSLPFASSN